MPSLLIAEVNGARAVYRPAPGNGITLPVIAWDTEGFALVADGYVCDAVEPGRLVRAVDAVVYNGDTAERCRFSGVDRTHSATGPLEV